MKVQFVADAKLYAKASIEMDTKELIEQLCKSLDLIPEVVLDTGRDSYYSVDGTELNYYEDTSYHGSPSYDLKSSRAISEEDAELYKLLKQIWKINRKRSK